MDISPTLHNLGSWQPVQYRLQRRPGIFKADFSQFAVKHELATFAKQSLIKVGDTGDVKSLAVLHYIGYPVNSEIARLIVSIGVKGNQIEVIFHKD